MDNEMDETDLVDGKRSDDLLILVDDLHWLHLGDLSELMPLLKEEETGIKLRITSNDPN